MDKVVRLCRILEEMGSCLVAFSGGADSTFLLAAAQHALPGKVLAVTAASQTYPAQELRAARRIAAGLCAPHMVIRTREMEDRRFRANSPQRCYYCKGELFRRLKVLARKKGLRAVAEASTRTDLSDFRPGTRAKEQARVRSPLLEAGLTKEEVRRISRSWGLPTWDKPSLACLASRIPYGTPLSAEALRRVNSAEEYLRRQGFSQVRVRDYGLSCRIEVEPARVPRAAARRAFLVARLKRLGYNYITLDLEGYRVGSMNEVRER
jgi:pyridinium-3,5-biscarboxylic acid mononucleotide sulfurtransferase